MDRKLLRSFLTPQTRISEPSARCWFMRARFDPRCNCEDFEYRQYIAGNVEHHTAAGVVTNLNHLFVVPGGLAPGALKEDGDTTIPAGTAGHNYGHRSAPPSPGPSHDRYLPNRRTGCEYSGRDLPELGPIPIGPANSGDRYKWLMRFRGVITRRGHGVVAEKYWAIRGPIVCTLTLWTHASSRLLPPGRAWVYQTMSNRLLQRKCACGGSAGVDGECAECRKKRLQRRTRDAASAEFAAGPAGIPPIVHDVLNAPGQPLDRQTRSFMEPRFGHDFSNVRVHSDTRAAESANAVNALAFTVGQNVVFGANQYAPHSSAGQELLAHELTHVVQQSSNSLVINSPSEISSPLEPAEHQAEQVAHQVIQARVAAPTALAGSIQSAALSDCVRNWRTPYSKWVTSRRKSTMAT